jgi:hypothetical protein
MIFHCHEASTDEQGHPAWRHVAAPNCITKRLGIILLELPADSKASCNGVSVVEIQVLEPGDIVRIKKSGEEEKCDHIGKLLPLCEPGAGRPDSFTGLPIEADALCCSCGELYDAQRTVPQIKECIVCGKSLNDDVEYPSEELL